MYELHYQPEGVWFGDCMPFFHEGVYYLFHQRDTRRPGPFGEPFGWALATTTDFVTYTDHGEIVLRGADDEQDQFNFAGSVFAANGRFVAAYTGFNRDFSQLGKPSQVLMTAVSDDLLHWEKTADGLVSPQEGYDPDDWRDPFVLWDDEHRRYLMILGARAAGERILTGRDGEHRYLFGWVPTKEDDDEQRRWQWAARSSYTRSISALTDRSGSDRRPACGQPSAPCRS